MTSEAHFAVSGISSRCMRQNRSEGLRRGRSTYISIARALTLRLPTQPRASAAPGSRRCAARRGIAVSLQPRPCRRRLAAMCTREGSQGVTAPSAVRFPRRASAARPGPLPTIFAAPASCRPRMEPTAPGRPGAFAALRRAGAVSSSSASHRVPQQALSRHPTLLRPVPYSILHPTRPSSLTRGWS